MSQVPKCDVSPKTSGMERGNEDFYLQEVAAVHHNELAMKSTCGAGLGVAAKSRNIAVKSLMVSARVVLCSILL